MSIGVARDFVFGLPKAELYLRPEGTLGPDLKLALICKNGVGISQSTVEEVQTTCRSNDLMSFLAIYCPAMDVLRDEDDFCGLAVAYFERARADGVVRAGCFLDPQTHTLRGTTVETVIRGHHRAIAKAREAGLFADLVLCFLRDMNVQSAFETLQAVLPYKDMLIGVRFDPDKHDDPPMKFAEVFALAREADLHMTMHCDIDQVDSIDNIRVALVELDAEHLDHGMNVIKDPELVTYARDHDIDLTSYPLSNSFVTEEMKGEEIAELIATGVKVSVNSDSPAYFDGYAGDNYLALMQCSGLGRADLERIARNSVGITWISDDEKVELLEHVNRSVSEN